MLVDWNNLTSSLSPSCKFCLCVLQVIDGGDLDIDFVLHAPDGRVLQMESRKTENVIRYGWFMCVCLLLFVSVCARERVREQSYGGGALFTYLEEKKGGGRERTNSPPSPHPHPPFLCQDFCVKKKKAHKMQFHVSGHFWMLLYRDHGYV